MNQPSMREQAAAELLNSSIGWFTRSLTEEDDDRLRIACSRLAGAYQELMPAVRLSLSFPKKIRRPDDMIQMVFSCADVLIANGASPDWFVRESCTGRGRIITESRLRDRLREMSQMEIRGIA